MALGTQQKDILMAVGVQWMRFRLMAIGTRHADFGLRVETNFYLKRARQISKHLITASTQQTGFGGMAMLKRTVMLRVVAKQ